MTGNVLALKSLDVRPAHSGEEVPGNVVFASVGNAKPMKAAELIRRIGRASRATVRAAGRVTAPLRYCLAPVREAHTPSHTRSMESRVLGRKPAALGLAAVSAALALTVLPGSAVAEEAADALLLRMEELLRSETNVATYAMAVDRPENRREFRMQIWDDRAGDRSFIRILAPARDSDTTFLRVDNNLWMFVPRLERDIKIPPAMMLNSWMGSDMTNDDLVRESSVLEDYENRILARAPGPSSTEVVTIESIPHADAPVVWGKLVLAVRSDGVPVRQEFYDEDGVLVRSMAFEDVRQLGARMLPFRWIVTDESREGYRTVLEIVDVMFDEPIPAQVFTRANLSRRR